MRCEEAHLQLFGPLLGECLVLIGEGESVVLGQGAQVEVVLGVGTGRHVDVELQLLQIYPLQLVPVVHYIIVMSSQHYITVMSSQTKTTRTQETVSDVHVFH